MKKQVVLSMDDYDKIVSCLDRALNVLDTMKLGEKHQKIYDHVYEARGILTSEDKLERKVRFLESTIDY